MISLASRTGQGLINRFFNVLFRNVYHLQFLAQFNRKIYRLIQLYDFQQLVKFRYTNIHCIDQR